MSKEIDQDPNPETFGGRVEIAKRQGKFSSDQKMADAVTQFLKRANIPVPQGGIPYQTIQSAQSRIVEGGISRYTLAIAYVSRVNPYWLAYGDRIARMLDGATSERPSWPFHFDISLWESIPRPKRREVETELFQRLVEVAEAQDVPASDPKSRPTRR